MNRSWLFYTGLVGFSMQGCFPKKIQTKKVQKVALEPTVFFSKKGKVVRLEEYSVSELFERAKWAFSQKKYERAIQLYQRIVTFYKESSYYSNSLYNLALSLERIKKYKEAKKYYTLVTTLLPDTETGLDAVFRLGACLLELKQWQEAEKIYARLVQMPKLEIHDRLEVMSRYGYSLYGQGKIARSEEMFRKTVRLYRTFSRKSYLGEDYFTAMAQFYLGRIQEERFRRRTFRAEKKLMKQDLDAKARDLLQAQTLYIRAIRIRNPHWILRSLYHIGQLYHQMYQDMLGAPLPKNLQEYEKKMYIDMLKKRIKVLLDKAVYVFERNIKAAEQLQLGKEEVVEQTRQRLDVLRNYIVKEFFAEPTSLPSKPETGKEKHSKSSKPKDP